MEVLSSDPGGTNVFIGAVAPNRQQAFQLSAFLGGFEELREYASDLKKAFVEDDPDLETSTCGCCESKRATFLKWRGKEPV